VQVLLYEGAGVNAKDRQDLTALLYAAGSNQGHKEIEKLLIKAGAKQSKH